MVIRRPADDLVPVNGRPEFQFGVTGILLRAWPDARPAGTPIGGDEGQVEGLLALAGADSKALFLNRRGGRLTTRGGSGDADATGDHHDHLGPGGEHVVFLENELVRLQEVNDELIAEVGADVVVPDHEPAV